MNLRTKKILATTTILLSMTGCFRKDKYIIDLKPNETAFVINNISNEKDDKTSKFDGTREAWSKVRSTSKMIIIPIVGVDVGTLKKRRLPAQKVVVVSESIVSRDWVADSNKGTSNQDQSLILESQSGVEFRMGLTLSAKITDPEKYVSVFGVDPNSNIDDVKVNSVMLPHVLDTTIRDNVQGYMNEEFGKYPTFEVQSKKSEVVNNVEERLKKDLASYGISLLSFNSSDTVTWKDPSIQKAIDEKARLEAKQAKAQVEQDVRRKEAETARLVAEQTAIQKAREMELRAEGERKKAEIDRLKAQEENKKELEKAQNEVLISREKSKIIDSEKKLLELEMIRVNMKVKELKAQAELEEARKWNGVKEFSNLTITGARSVVGKDGEVKVLNTID